MTNPQSATPALLEFGFTEDQTGLEIAQAWIDAGVVAGYVGTLGVRPVHAERGSILFSCPADANLGNFAGTIHGGVAASLIDIAGAGAALTLLEPGEILLTGDLQLRYCAPIPIDGGAITARGTARYDERRRIIAEVFVHHGGQTVAVGSVAVVRRTTATG
ncbi:MAG: PaaI family thioesterase [Sphingomonadales bacterium]|tara:strand:+ start:1502 stop:1984 length:483 start_codon:yes stop_codon:yes gene_type:complete